ncbi:hypothetical protein [Nonomuraea basaltis]|nr:hypothetical protein [Nonomuraea basaltis]
MSAEIVRLLARMTETWNAGDARAYAELFTPEGWRFASFQNTRVGRP